MSDLSAWIADETLKYWNDFRMVDKSAVEELAQGVADHLEKGIGISHADIVEALIRPEQMVRLHLGPLGERQNRHVRGFFVRLANVVHTMLEPAEQSKAA